MTVVTRMLKLVIALVAMALLLTSCGAPAADHAAHSGDGTPAAQPVSDFSVYELAADWTNQEDETAPMSALAGRPRVVAMVYTHCAYACPRIVTDMKKIEAELAASGVDAGLVLISIDPERDTPGRLASFAESLYLDTEKWALLTGSDDAILELAAVLGVRYRRVSDMDFEHSNIITLLDGDGRIVHRQTGLGADPAALVAAATSLGS